MGAMRFTDLRAWKAAVDLSLEIYQITTLLPRDEQYGLSSQLKRASVSIGSNIAEGFGRWSPRDQARFYEIAKGSAEEVRHLLILSERLGLLKVSPQCHRRIDAVCGMLHSLRQVVLSKSRRI